MNFKLCYKEYDFKVTWSAKRDFKRETGRGLWSTLQGVYRVMIENKDKPVLSRMEAVGLHIDEVDAATLLWCLAKQCNSSLKINEIADACDRMGWRPSDGDEWAQPYPYVLYKMMSDIDAMYAQEAIQAKKDLCHTEEASN